MDGFHPDGAELRERGTQARKGAPHTFDLLGIIATVGRLARNAEDETFVPVLDRHLEISRAGAQVIPRKVPLVLVEGNYLLLPRPGWSRL